MFAYMLGRHADLAIAELAVRGATIDSIVGTDSALFALSQQAISISVLGGSVKRYALIDTKPLSLKDVQSVIIEHIRATSTRSRISIGFNCYAEKIDQKTLHSIIGSIGSSLQSKVRLINQKTTTLNSASSVHNKTYKGSGDYEFLLVDASDGSLLIGALDDVQNLKQYTDRDRYRPRRDAKIGMLPPKLAQIMVNLACGETVNATVLDPFCGTGVVLQEAMLLGHDVFGSDINPDMVSATDENLDWLKKRFKPTGRLIRPTQQLDAQTGDWAQEFDHLVSETYLGQPLSRPLSDQEAVECADQIKALQHRFLDNASKQLRPGGHMCISLPAWRTRNGGLVTSDLIDNPDYKRYNLTQIPINNLGHYVYSRPDQVVARCIIVLKKDD